MADVLLVEALVMRRLALVLVVERFGFGRGHDWSPETPKGPRRGPWRQS